MRAVCAGRPRGKVVIRTEKLPKWLRTSAAVAGAVALLSAPFFVLGYIAKHDTPEARERRIAATFGKVRSSSTQSRPSGYPADKEDETAAEKEVQLGCWRLESHAQGPATLKALWYEECPDPRRPTLSAGEYPFPSSPFYLSAWGEGTPRLQAARTVVELSDDLSDTEDTKAGMLFLPATTQGNGYFVAAWAQLGADGRIERGMRVGHYGAAPTSVETSAGRVFLEPPRPALEQLDDAADPDEEGGA